MSSRRTLLVLATALATPLAGCSPEVVDSDADAIDQYIWSLPYLPSDPEQVQMGDRGAATQDGDYLCTTQNLAETRQYDKIVAYAANSESMWPGAILSGESVLTGLFTQNVFRREPMTISVGLESLEGKKSAVVRSPSLAGYRDALTSILDATVTGATPANIYSEIEEVHSETQLSLALGVDVSWGLGTGSVESSFDWSREETRSRFVVKFTQAYYTVDIDVPETPSSFFASDVSLGEIQARMTAQNPPVYVSSITYGRMVLFTYESDYSSEEMNAALEFAYSGGVDVSGDVSVSYKEIISNSKITAYILGGSGADAVRSLDSYEALMDFIRAGGDYSADSPGAAIAYKLNYLKDNAPARLSFTTDYDLRECERVSQRVKLVLRNIMVENAADSGDDLELYGRIWAEADQGGELFNKNEDNYVTIRQGEAWPNGAQVSEIIFKVKPQPGEAIRLRADLKDYDPYLPDDDMGNETVLAPFESGWRKEQTVMLTGDGARIKLTFQMTPM